MVYKVIYSEKAEKDLEKLEKAVSGRILKKIFKWSQDKTPLKQSKKLKGLRRDTHRYRIGDYRIIFTIDPVTQSLVILLIVRVLHRREVYNASL